MARRMPPVWFILKNGRSWPGVVTSEVPQGPISYPPTPPGPAPDSIVIYNGMAVTYNSQSITTYVSYPEGGYGQ